MNLKKRFRAITRIPLGFATVLKQMFQKPVTLQYPEEKRPMTSRFRGRHNLKRYDDGLEKCIGCALCAAACPADAIWVEAAVTAEDPTPLFLERVRTNETATAKRLGTVVVEGGASDEATVILANTEGIVGTDIRVPILINSTGGEVAVSFSLTYNAAILAPRSVAPGPDAFATWVRLNTNAVGRVGVLAILPDEYAMPAGAKHAFTITFAALQTGVVAVTFGDLPTARDIGYLDVEAFPDIVWLDGTVTVVDPGYEGDVAPRPRGDRAITAAEQKMAEGA